MTTLLAYAAVFGWSFLAATVLPVGSEAALAALVIGQGEIWPPVLVATLGNYLGSCTTYWIGRQAGARIVERHASSRAMALLRRAGQPALLLAWVPVIGDVLVALAGAARMPFLPFSCFTAAGKLLRYIAVALAASAV